MRAGKPGASGGPFAISLRRLRWPAVLAWILAIVLLHGLSSSLPNVTSDGASTYLPGSATSAKVALLQQAADRLAGQSQPAQGTR
jgi:uncharacterized membrane protein YdfJ with MMPL/SSD domain